MKRYATARLYFQESLQLYTEIEKRESLPPGLHGAGNEQYLLAGTHQAMGEFDVAENYYLKAIAYFQHRYPEHGWYLKSIMKHLAGLYSQLGRDTEASEWLARAAELDTRQMERR